MTPTEAANEASQLSGLPAAFTLALIQAEQGPAQLAVTGNPFDVTNGWLNIAGLGSIVTGLWNDLGGGLGVAIVNDPNKAIVGWWAGLSTFKDYVQFRADLAAGASARTLLNDLSKANYAGGDPNWANNVAKIYTENSGLSADIPLAGGTVITLPPPPIPVPGGPTPAPAPAPTPTTTGDTLTLTKSTDPVFGGLIDSVNSFQAGLLAVVLSVERFFWIVIGLAIIALGTYILVQGKGKDDVNP